EAPQRAVHEPLVARPQVLRADAELLRRTGAEALDEDVRSLGKPAEDVEAPVAPEVERERPLPGVRGEEEDARPARVLGAPCAGLVASAGMLDLDHVGAERAQDLRAVGAGERRR